jgi:hypothetical protein
MTRDTAADIAFGLQQELRPKPQRWGLWSTLAWMLLIGVIYTLAQMVTALLFLFWWEAAYPGQPLNLADIETNGPILGTVTLVSTAAILSIVALAVGLSHQSFKLYLALNWPSRRVMALSFGLTLALLFTIDFVTAQAGHDVIPEFMSGIYETSREAGTGFFVLLGVTLIVLAPLSEEIVFRGFFYRGLDRSLGPIAAILITAACWTALHVQYEPFSMAQVFAYGIFLGLVRWRSNSLILVVILHAAINAIALNQIIAFYGA